MAAGAAEMAGLGMASVYRTIEALTEEGWLVPVEMPGTHVTRCEAKPIIIIFTVLSAAKQCELDECLEHL